MLPAIFFIFSRRDCDQAVQKTAALPNFRLTTPEEEARLFAMYQELERSQPESVRPHAAEAFVRGMAAHHAGMLPGWKKLIESAFQQGLLKVIFATETLAAGINMPARTTVISVVSRKRGSVHSLLKHNEITQMAGRAGRRGYDDIGHAVVLQSRWDGAAEAFEIIQRGPEMLTSQFNTSYGLVLSLLATKSLKEARSFVERSFGNYLGGEGLRRRTEEIETLEDRARALQREAAEAEAKQREEGESNNLEPIMEEILELKAAKKLAKRQLRRLRKAAHVQRAERAAALIQRVGGGLPARVGVDLPVEDSPSWAYRLGDEVEEELSQALLIRELTAEEVAMMPLEGATASVPMYLALSSDNRLLAISGHFIAAVAQPRSSVELKVEEGAFDSHRFDLRHNAWKQLSADCFAMNGSNFTAGLAVGLADTRGVTLTHVALDEDLLASIFSYVEQIQQVGTTLPKLQRKLPESVQQGGLMRDTLQRASNPAQSPQDLEERAEKIARRASRMRKALQQQLGASWVCFQEMVDILVKFGALDKNDLSVRPLGEVAREIRGSNELWLAACLMHPAVQGLRPAPLAGLIAGLIASESMGSRPNIYVGYPPSQEVLLAATELEDLREDLAALQMSTTSVTCSLQVDLRFSGLVEAWAAGAGWFEVCRDTSLDEGDLARLLGRTADLLRQIIFIAHVLPGVKDNAKAALRSMNRSPISELVS